MDLDEYINSLIAESTQETVAKDAGSHGSELCAFLSGKGRLNLSVLTLLLKKKKARIIMGDEIEKLKKDYERQIKELTNTTGTLGRLLNEQLTKNGSLG